jgi:hypothetical protein
MFLFDSNNHLHQRNEVFILVLSKKSRRQILKKFLLGLLIGVIVILVILVGVGGYLGIVPGVSSLFGSNKPKNLGVTFTSQDLTDAQSKAGTQIVTLSPNLPPSQSISFSGQKNVNTTFTQGEFNAWMDNSWDDALLGCQLKIDSDGTAEFSGVLHTDRIKSFEEAMGVSASDMSVIDKYVRFIKGNPAIYIKGTGSVVNGQINLDVQQMKVGNLSVPSGIIQDNEGSLISFMQKMIDQIPGLSINNAAFVNGAVHFDGTLPAVVSVSPIE